MSTSTFLCDLANGLALELGAWKSFESFPVEAVLSVEEAKKELVVRREDDASAADLLHLFAVQAGFKVEVRTYHELPEGLAYAGGLWNLEDAWVRFWARFSAGGR